MKTFSLLIISVTAVLCRRDEHPSGSLPDLNIFEASDTTSLSKILLAPNGEIIVGGRNVLYKLNNNLEMLENVSIGPELNNPLCFPEPALCLQGRSVTDNDIKVLHVYQKEFILLCGSVNQGLCQFHWISDLNTIRKIGDPLKTVNYISGNNSVVSFFEGETFYSASTYDGRALNMSNFFMSSKVLPVTENASVSFQYTYLTDTSISAVDFNPAFKKNYIVQYIDGFSHQGYSYFITVQKTGPHLDSYESRIVRVCQNDTRFFSYTEIPLRCQTESANFNLATAMYLAESTEATRYSRQVTPPPEDQILYITFLKSRYANIPKTSQGSVLCKFSMIQIQDHFKKAVKDCFGGESRTFRLESIVGTRARCDTKSNYDLNEALCDPGGNNYIEGRESIPGGVKASFNGLASSLFITMQNSESVAFVGTTEGNILKLSLKPIDSIVLYNISLYNETTSTSTNTIERNFAYDEVDDNLFFLSGNKVIKFPIGSCQPYTDCRSCLASHLRDPLNCGWCGSFCAHDMECDSTIQRVECPPIINEITPLFGPTGGGTLINIRGDNFGNGQGTLNVTINNMPCGVIRWKNKFIQCRTNKIPESSGPIKLSVSSFFESETFDAKGIAFSKEIFTFVSPKFYGIWPDRGPKAGGTSVSVFGDKIDIGLTHSIKLVGVSCKIQNITENEIQCISGPVQSTTVDPVVIGTATLCIDGNCLSSHPDGYKVKDENRAHSYFKYVENPIIHSITPSVTIKSGGTNLTIYGQHLDNIKQPQLEVTIFSSYTGKQTEYIKDCSIDDKYGKTLICQTPALDLNIPISDRAPLRALISFIMDGVTELRNLSQTHPKLAELLYYPDPVYHKFGGSRNIFKVPVDDPVVEIKGLHLNFAQSKKEVKVLIQGPTPCNITRIDVDSLYCIIPQTYVPSKANETLKAVEVIAGNLHFKVGYIQFADPSSKLGVAAIVSITAAIIVLLGIIFLVLYKKGYIFKKKKAMAPGYAVAFSNEQDDNTRTANDYSDHLIAGRTTSNGRVENGACGGGEASSSSRASLFGNRVNEETVQLLEAEGILYQRTCLVVLDVIGQGHFGKVYKGMLTLPGKEDERAVAVKTLQNSRYRDNEDVESFLQEGLMMKDFHHHNVLTLIGVCFEDDGFPMVIIPFMAHGDLLSYIRDENNYPTVKDLLTFGIHIAEGMKYLSDLKFVHRDLAARNCMIDEDMTLKVADFGLSRDIYERDYYSSDNKKSKLPVKWMAPESLEKGTYSNKSDVWSYGVVLWELMTRGNTPYPEVDNWEILHFVKSGRRMLQPSFCPDLLYQLMIRCWADDPKMRPVFSKIAEEVKDIIRKMETKNKHMRVGTKVTYYNCPVVDKDSEESSETTTPILSLRT